MLKTVLLMSAQAFINANKYNIILSVTDHSLQFVNRVCCQQEPHRPWSPPVAPSGPGRGASEMDQGSAKRPKDDSLMPLVIPVSVPVRQTSSPDHEQPSLSASWPMRPSGSYDMISDYKTSVIVTRRRSLRNSLSESSGQVGTRLI